MQATSSGDALIGADDTWVEAANPAANGASSRGPHAVVLGTQAGTGNFQRDPFGNALPATGLEANFYAYKNTLTLAPGQTKSLLRYVVAGRAETAATAGAQSHRRQDRRDRRWPPRPTWPASRRASAARSPTGRAVRRRHLRREPRSRRSRAEAAPKLPVTTSGYDVVDKSITQMAADMKSGLTTSQAITRAYLDRIAAYDSGPFGFHAFITVAERRDGPGQGRRRRARRRQHERPARHPGDRQGPLRHQGHADDRRQRSRSTAGARSATPSRSRSCARPAP